MPHQHRNIALAFSQRRHTNGEDIEPVIQVTAKLFFRHALSQVAIRGSNQAYVYANGASAAQSFELLVLQHAQQLRLELQRDISYFVQKQTALVSQFQASNFLTDRTAFSWPNSSLSSKPVGIAAQFNLTKIRSFRELMR